VPTTPLKSFLARVLGTLAPSIAALLVWLFPIPDAKATTYTHTFCISLKTGFVDAATGDLGTSGAWYARGVLFTAYGATRNTDESDGCKTFTSTSGGLTTLTIYAQSKIGSSGNITISAFPTAAAQQTWENNPTNANLPKWVLSVLPSCTGTNCTTTVTNTANSSDAVSNLLSAGIWVVYRIDTNTSPRLSGTRTLRLNNSGCNGAVDGSCQDGNTLEIQSGWNGAFRKFLIGHEVGHWLHSKWIGGNVLGTDDPYVIEGPFDPDGDCHSIDTPGAHAFRSLEFERGAFTEGVAHYFSTLAFNYHTQTDGSFKYYKDTSLYTFDSVDVEGGPSGGLTNYYANGCGCPTDCNWDEAGDVGLVYADEIGTELDWLRAYWDFRTNAGTQPSHWDIFAHLDAADAQVGGYGMEDTHDRLEAVLPPGFATRWDVAMDANGADNTPE
jgi:hypothetical protein